ncbi:bifunctional proline dehydrogenase/L-glutamate gamma-semialdehyde dehydrogenase PutA [Ponticoccus sp. SC2-23]|uniref:bifunctional proline dehydrogenase/L-glutamate gamma-semialdehyde dehydrogenase PutA n=1 Tax=Alexandriicola marinus TaxID=2081710 RepID=UPI000FDC00B5|nr:bifunctional proline dehydrogenase/L-glutamate gamma-semialdehyde dehydrogenase PutA [Alexandriicola marinus]MBM1219986.1 bifunctional proline dehydrogenase/L-glutamate gamma-semialdehyde dehydrogenase PutA [Ponticoccus sp. SC6-9]MBM1224672.1 bifunctional proline dehydrogenase/L-glutamate gamma-semialdehyde dehydrogenase PutA [Ponticoccus sp. SC6-15]MBM1228185.1 bifunctional proline dehydrogenase/L-glutamate gamma-semialdehyde dehydrogenase PutA [Ponticoccus sp. SC6-38]MBM1234177.1 bifunctio
MPRDTFHDLRARIDGRIYASERPVIEELRDLAALSAEARVGIVAEGAALVRQIRGASDPGLMEVFLAEYGLSTEEGIALMCLAEALLRVPDADTIDALIEDKIAPSDWGRHLGHSTSSLVNASTWALMLTGRVLDDEQAGIVGALRGAVRRLGEPVIRTAVGRAMREMGRQFVLGETIAKAMDRAEGMQAKGFTYSYDMLGEAARTDADARGYHLSYSRAISAIAEHCTRKNVADNPGISVKLSALHPRYEEAQRDRVMEELVPRLRSLAQMARSAGMGLNIDAEEADRLSLSLDVIEETLSAPGLRGWDGFGVVVQAYGQRAGLVLDWLHELATRLDRRIMVRLVKGAYWDTEIKRAQVEGMEGFPVFTDKAATDISYIANARKLLGMTDRIYPQFATHNAHTVAAILHMAREMGRGPETFEFQRLHGMGEVLHKLVMAEHGTRCRIYAPVGAHKDLLAYLVRRLLENGANSSFVNQIVDETVPPEEVASDPFSAPLQLDRLPQGPEIFGQGRRNSKGFDLTHAPTLEAIDKARRAFVGSRWEAGPVLAVPAQGGDMQELRNPARPSDVVGAVTWADPADVEAAFRAAQVWDAPVAERAAILRRAADLYEAHFGEIFALVAREAGKTLSDAVGELREAVDFLRYYAGQAEAMAEAAPRGPWVCISPWNFPLAIFTGQIAAALATGNAVLAKPAEQTPLIAARAVALLHEAGVPREVLQLLPGDGRIGAALTSDPRIAGVAFTGSTETAQIIARAMAGSAAPGTPLIAETGGLNAMVVDSTALPEHAVRDIVKAAFRSAGQRCSALRCLYVQEDVAEPLIEMLRGAMAELSMGDPWQLSTDVGPVIDTEARDGIAAYVAAARDAGRVIDELQAPAEGLFVPPVILEVGGIGEMEREVFGPVLHVARFRAEKLDRVIEDINRTGYGLTFGLHTRIDDRVQHIVDRVHVGNIYVNRDQIGAVVGSQPFGGEGLSGTGPKAGGPNYLPRFAAPAPAGVAGGWSDPETREALAARLVRAEKAGAGAHEPLDLPGPTGESNRLTLAARGPVLCLGPGADTAAEQARAIRDLGGIAVEAQGALEPGALSLLAPLAGVIWWGSDDEARALAAALARREGPLVPLITAMPDRAHACHERHVCIDTTAAGGNAALLAAVADG